MSPRQTEYMLEALRLRAQYFFNSVKRAEEEILPKYDLNMAFIRLYDVCYDIAKCHSDNDYCLIYHVLKAISKQEIFIVYYQKYIKLLAEDE